MVSIAGLILGILILLVAVIPFTVCAVQVKSVIPAAISGFFVGFSIGWILSGELTERVEFTEREGQSIFFQFFRPTTSYFIVMFAALAAGILLLVLSSKSHPRLFLLTGVPVLGLACGLLWMVISLLLWIWPLQSAFGYPNSWIGIISFVLSLFCPR